MELVPLLKCVFIRKRMVDIFHQNGRDLVLIKCLVSPKQLYIFEGDNSLYSGKTIHVFFMKKHGMLYHVKTRKRYINTSSLCMKHSYEFIDLQPIGLQDAIEIIKEAIYR